MKANRPLVPSAPVLLVLSCLLAGSAAAAGWEQAGQACIARWQQSSEEERVAQAQRLALETRDERARELARFVDERLPEYLEASDSPREKLLLRLLQWAAENRKAGVDPASEEVAEVDHDTSLATLREAIADGATDPLILAASLIACPPLTDGETASAACAGDPARRLMEADPDNAYPLLQAAQRAWVTDREEQAYELMAKTVDAKTMDWYYGESQKAVLETLERYWTESTPAPDELAMMAQELGPMIIGYPGFMVLGEMCRPEALDGEQERARACVNGVEALTRPGASLMDVSVAAGMASRLATALDEKTGKRLEEWATIQRRKVDEIQQQLAQVGCLALEDGADAYQSLYGAEYLSDVIEYGELAAQERLIERFAEGWRADRP